MEVLFIGDMVSPEAIDVVEEEIRRISRHQPLDLVIANGENIHPRNGLIESDYHALIAAGVDVVTLGNHTWDQKSIYNYIDEAERLVRPFNYPEGTPGQGVITIESGAFRIAVIAAMGNIYVSQLPSPFLGIDTIINALHDDGIQHIIVDMHGEATSEKNALAWYLDGRVSAVLGTHTHVATADARILPKGTATQTDVGMVGPYPSILGMDVETSISRFITQRPIGYKQAEVEEMIFNATLISLNKQGKATNIKCIKRLIGGCP